MIEEEVLRLPNFSLDMEVSVSPASILFLPIAARLIVSILRFSINVLFVDATNVLLFCVALGILSYKTVMDSSLMSGILVGLGSRVVLTYFMQGRRWTVLSGFLLGVFTSDVVTLFWGYVSQHTWEAEQERLRQRRKLAKTRARRISDPRRPSASLASMAASNDTEMMKDDADKEAITLKRNLALAEAEIRRAQEERIWAITQGNEARASQLKRQIDRNETLIRNYRKDIGKLPFPEKKEVSTGVAPSIGTIDGIRTIDAYSIHTDAPSIRTFDAPSIRSSSMRTTDASSVRTIDAPSLRSVSTVRKPGVRGFAQRVAIANINDSILSDGEYSDADPVRLHTREHRTQRFTLEDGSEVQLTQVHLGRNKEKEPLRTGGLSVPITIIDSPTRSDG